ncbi:MAG: hypothetical protein H9W81_01200 [Enterococcus sp.]|nr:hypothetical protein [Enterococcus sp.]
MLEEKDVTHYTGEDAEVAYFAGRDLFDMERFVPVEDRPKNELWQEPGAINMYGSKPENGGIWTSPGNINDDGTLTTRWSEHGDRGYSRVAEMTTPIVVKKNAVIVRVDSADDVRRLKEIFPDENNSISYQKMAAAGIDGLHLSQSGLNEAKSYEDDDITPFACWDIESTVWINKDNLISHKPVKTSENQVIDEDDYYEYPEDDYIPYDYDGLNGGSQTWDQFLASRDASLVTPQ